MREKLQVATWLVSRWVRLLDHEAVQTPPQEEKSHPSHYKWWVRRLRILPLLSKSSSSPQLSSPKPWMMTVLGFLILPQAAHRGIIISPFSTWDIPSSAQQERVLWVIPAPPHKPQKQHGAYLHSVQEPFRSPCLQPSLHSYFLHSQALCPPCGNASCMLTGSWRREELTYQLPSERHQWPG